MSRLVQERGRRVLHRTVIDSNSLLIFHDFEKLQLPFFFFFANSISKFYYICNLIYNIDMYMYMYMHTRVHTYTYCACVCVYNVKDKIDMKNINTFRKTSRIIFQLNIAQCNALCSSLIFKYILKFSSLLCK